MKKLCFLVILIVTCGYCEGQNLVPNGDFEQYSACPGPSSVDVTLAVPWINPGSGAIVGGTPDYFNQCSTLPGWDVPVSGFGYQIPHSGQAYAGIILYYDDIYNAREYIEVQLTSPLSPGLCYHFEMYMALSEEYGKYTTDDIGVYFSNTLVTGNNHYQPLTNIPQLNNTQGNYPDSLNWILLSGNYTAIGGENYIVIGNFKNNANTNFILYNATAIYDESYIFIDDVSLTLCTGLQEQNDLSGISLYPNPFSDEINISTERNELIEIIVYDAIGNKVIKQSFTISTSLNTEKLAKGIYMYEVKNRNGVLKKDKIVKY